MADAVTFRPALKRIGFNANTRDALAENGFFTLADLTTIHDSDIDKLPRHLAAWRDPTADPDDQVRVPLITLTKLKALRYWVISQRCVGDNNPNATLFTNVVMEETLARMQAEIDQKAATEETTVQKPEKLAEDPAKWTTFWELFTPTYLGRVRGAVKIPLTYLIRKHDVPTQAIPDEEYAFKEDELIAITVHTGTHYELDNKTLYDEFQPLLLMVLDGVL